MSEAYSPESIEKRVLEHWKKENIQKKVKDNREKAEPYYFCDGPPYASGNIHMGTAWNKVLKDFHIRYFRMKGYDVWSQPGYDTHGLPIENKVEKKLGLKHKSDIEKLGVEAFIKSCMEFATEHISTMNAAFANLGVWMDWDKPYLTLNNEYIEGAWHTFKVAYKKGYLYKGNYPVHVCPHCETAVAYNEIEYTTVNDPSVFVKFKVKGKENEYLLIWTTTPWTLPANTGIMAHPNFDYVRVKAGNETLILAKERLQAVLIGEYKVTETFKGSELEGLAYENPLKGIFQMQEKVQGKVVLSAQHVTLDTGTGLVHTAPGHGLEDFKVGQEYKLDVLSPVKLDGTYTSEAGKYAGKFVKSADKGIIEDLKSLDALYSSGTIRHEYPKCWRCESPLLTISVPQWFFKVSQLKEKLLAENATVNWVPDWAGKRFENWIDSLGDWPISRQRYWGIPLPIWQCECGEIKVIESRKELGVEVKDLHKPYIDAVELKCKCGKKMKRVSDVLDVWFDSGVATWASLGFPEKKDQFKRMWPSKLQMEGPDQIRGWWNSQMIASVITFDTKPFENIIFHGFVLDAHGIKMSKSKGNIVSPDDMVKMYGRDALRLYLLKSPPWEDFYFSMENLKDASRVLNVLWNSYAFIKAYCKRADKPKELNIEDKWLLSRTNSLIKKCRESNDALHGFESVQAISEFVLEDLSRWYIKLVRDRTWPTYTGKDRDAAFYSLYYALDNLVDLLAPICPLTSEAIYLDINGHAESVHMHDFPKADESLIDAELEAKMGKVKQISEAMDSARQEAKIKLRYPAKRVLLSGIDIKGIESVLATRCNVKTVEAFKEKGPSLVEREVAGGKAYLDTEETPELVEEGLLRELERAIQQARKEQGLKVEEKIRLFISTDKDTEAKVSGRMDALKANVGASAVVFREVSKPVGSCEFRERAMKIGLERA